MPVLSVGSFYLSWFAYRTAVTYERRLSGYLGNPGARLLFFCYPVRRQAVFSQIQRVWQSAYRRYAGCALFVQSSYGLFFSSLNDLSGRELAWLFSAVFWCALGALFLFICARR